MDHSKSVVLSLKNLHKHYIVDNEDRPTVVDVSVDVYDNEFLVILGPGHSGKSVLLNMIAGIEKPTMGEIYYKGERVTGSHQDIAMVFQRLALMPWKTVMANVEFGLELRGMPVKERRAVAQRYIDLVKLTGFEKHYPAELSGGMKQRVGIARAYTTDPAILLMDEPFGQLDAQTRYFMQEEIQRIWEKEKKTIIFVTNNIEEAVYLGDRILLFTKYPARVKQIYDINLPRPRDTISEEFLRIRKEISDNTEVAL